MRRAILRYWHTLRFLRAHQIAARLRLRTAAALRCAYPAAAHRLYERRAALLALVPADNPLGLHGAAARVRAELSEPERAELAGRVRQMEAGTFTWLNRRVSLGSPIGWAAPGESRLWRYHLHYFDYLVDLALADGESRPRLLALIRDWIAANPLGSAGAADAWHPYVVSLRLVNWMLALAVTADEAETTPPDIARSLAEHALFVERNLERDVGGNHLLKNLKALVFAGCFWDGETACRWRETYAAQFVQALNSQVLADGGHYERSPMYHALVLADLLEVMAVMRSLPVPLTGDWPALARRMAGFLREVTHPDGEIALFNDSAFAVAPPPRTLHTLVAGLLDDVWDDALTLRQRLFVPQPTSPPERPRPARRAERGALKDDPPASGYVVLASTDRTRYLIADVGDVCPDELPAHAHADLLSYELSVDGVRLIVDSGVSQYAAGPWRDYYRSTRAHNTVVVDDIDQSECWGSFRVGRRARPVDVVCRSTSGTATLGAAHTGYERLALPVRHRRSFAFVEEKFWLIVDTLSGRGDHEWKSYIHFHPEASGRLEGAASFYIKRGQTGLTVVWFGPLSPEIVCGTTNPIEGWYAPEFGRREPSTTLVLHGRGRVPVCLGYALVPAGAQAGGLPAVSQVGDADFVVTVGAARYEVSLADSLVRANH